MLKWLIFIFVTGEAVEAPKKVKDAAAASLGRRGSLKNGTAIAKRCKALAKKAAKKHWSKK